MWTLSEFKGNPNGLRVLYQARRGVVVGNGYLFQTSKSHKLVLIKLDEMTEPIAVEQRLVQVESN